MPKETKKKKKPLKDQDLTGLVAQRFAGKPLRQPNYSMRDVPKANPDLSYSSLYEISSRDHFNDSMAAFVLLCNEVMRRKRLKNKENTAKPLSLEYMADRLDVDDPLRGFMVRTDKLPPGIDKEQKEYFQKGMLQGFITVTTFTNWQESFRWDSLHPSAFAYDDEDLQQDMMDNKRKWDRDGSLSKELQSQVKCGDPWNEGIVYPKIAEISLLGGLGCGKALLGLAIERLENMAPTAEYNYDYVALQATDNSIPFYESMGFVRVGAVTDAIPENEEEEEQKEEKTQIVSSPFFIVNVPKHGETPLQYAKKYNVNVWDIIYLSHFLYPDMTPRSPLMKGTQLYIPKVEKEEEEEDTAANATATSTQWHEALDNETPREIAKKFNVPLNDLLTANRTRIADLKANSKLIEGTRIQVSNLDEVEEDVLPYIHWTFPDTKFKDNPDPSYMMVRKLNRKRKPYEEAHKVENSLAVKVNTEYNPDDIPTSVVKPKEELTITKKTKKRKRHPEQPFQPKRPKTAFFVFMENERERLKRKNVKIAQTDLARVTAEHWRSMPEETKKPYVDTSIQLKQDYENAMTVYNQQMVEFKQKYPDWTEKEVVVTKTKKNFLNLFNKVVKLTKEGKRLAGDEYEYYYVLTYIPDLFWCHLAPMRKAGVFTNKKYSGRTKWMLVDESEGKEIDITASACTVVKSTCTKKCDDADKEEWNIVDDTKVPVSSEMKQTVVMDAQKTVPKSPSPQTVVDASIATTDENSAITETVPVSASSSGDEIMIVERSEKIITPQTLEEKSPQDRKMEKKNSKSMQRTLKSFFGMSKN